MFKAIASTFPNTRNLPREEQLQIGRSVLGDVLKNEELMGDIRTEAAF